MRRRSRFPALALPATLPAAQNRSPTRSRRAYREQQPLPRRPRRLARDLMQPAEACRQPEPPRPCVGRLSRRVKSSGRLARSASPPSPRRPARLAQHPDACARRAQMVPPHSVETPAPSRIPEAPCASRRGSWSVGGRAGAQEALQTNKGHHLILRISSGGGRRGRAAGLEPSVRHWQSRKQPLGHEHTASSGGTARSIALKPGCPAGRPSGSSRAPAADRPRRGSCHGSRICARSPRRASRSPSQLAETVAERELSSELCAALIARSSALPLQGSTPTNFTSL